MSILNDKEQVIDLVLTKHGERLLSLGKLKPVYYEFFDDDVLYDNEAAQFSAEQNTIEERIRKETKYLSTQNHFQGATIENIMPDDSDGGVYALGNSQLSVQNAPSWKLSVHEGKISNVDEFYIGKGYTQEKVPQVDIDAYYTITTQPSKKTTDLEGYSTEDGVIIYTEYEDIIITLVEQNVDLRKDKFNVEIFEIKENSASGRDVLITLTDSGFDNLFEREVDKEIDSDVLWSIRQNDIGRMFINKCALGDVSGSNRDNDIYNVDDTFMECE